MSAYQVNFQTFHYYFSVVYRLHNIHIWVLKDIFFKTCVCLIPDANHAQSQMDCINWTWESWDGWDSLWLLVPDIHKSHIWIPDLLKSHKCIPGAHLFPYYKSFSFTPVYHIKQHIHCSFLQVWDYDRNKDDDFLGRCHLDLRFLSTDHNTSFLIIPSRIPKKFYVPVTIAMEKRRE